MGLGSSLSKVVQSNVYLEVLGIRYTVGVAESKKENREKCGIVIDVALLFHSLMAFI